MGTNGSPPSFLFVLRCGDQVTRVFLEDVGRLCSIEIDRHENVERWIRNPSYASQGGFWLPKSPGRFSPDFIVELKSGQTVIVEYKNSTLSADPEEQHKRTVGELWAERSEGQCRFAYVIDRDWATLAEKLDS